jgi:hypothetical protein
MGNFARRGGFPEVRGFPLAMGRALVIVQVMYDFYLDGYDVLPIKAITQTTSEGGRSFQEYVYHKTGKMSEVRLPENPPGLDEWRDCFLPLAATGQVVIVECERRKKRNGFIIGPVIGLSESAVGILYFSPKGVWDRKPTVVPFVEITRVRIGDGYSMTFAKHLKPIAMI